MKNEGRPDVKGKSLHYLYNLIDGWFHSQRPDDILRIEYDRTKIKFFLFDILLLSNNRSWLKSYVYAANKWQDDLLINMIWSRRYSYTISTWCLGLSVILLIFNFLLQLDSDLLYITTFDYSQFIFIIVLRAFNIRSFEIVASYGRT